MNIKTLGLTFAAVLAATAVMASGASGANFTASSYPANGEGGQTTKHVLTFQGQKLECTEISFTGSLAAAAPGLTINPKFGGCTAFGFVNAAIHLNSCDFYITVFGNLQIQCTKAGDSITITAGTCVVHVPPQTLGNVFLTNSVPKILIRLAIVAMRSSITSGFLCPLTAKSEDTSGAYTGETLFESTEGKTLDVG